MNGETQSNKSDPSGPSAQLSPTQPISPSEVLPTKHGSTEPNRIQATPPSTSAPKRPFAWQPLTPKGIAAFAVATFGRTLTVEFVFALLVASMVVWFLSRDWAPVITRAIKQMPAEGQLLSGRLSWAGESPISLAENRFLAIAVDLKHEGQVRSPAHVAIELGERDFKIYSLLGYVEGHYPPGWWVGVNRTDAMPWWGAWAPPILGIVALVVILSLLICWAILATVYMAPAWLAGFFANRELTLGGSWRLAGASLMPGCLFFIGAIFVYGLGLLDLVQLGVGVAAHFIVAWIYIWLSIRKLPLHPEAAAAKGNPFTSTSSAEKKNI